MKCIGFFIFLLCILFSCLHVEFFIPVVNDGYINLKSRDCERSGSIELTGDWFFEWMDSTGFYSEADPVFIHNDAIKVPCLRNDLKGSFLLGIIFMNLVYNIIFWVGRKKDKYTLYFALFCFLILIKLFPVPHYLFFKIQSKINPLAQMLSLFALSNYFHSLFPKETNMKILKFTNVLFLSLSVLTLFLNPNQKIIFSHVNYIITSLFALWLIYILIIAVKRKKKSALILLSGFTILLLTVLNDILYSHRIIYTFFMSNLGIALYLMSQTIVISKVFFYNFKSIENVVQNLQNEVKKRTEELENAKKEIQVQSEQKTLFFINFAHETKIPLTIIQNNLNEYLKKAKLTNELKIIKAHINKLYRDIVHLLDFKKIEKGILLYNNDTVIDASESLMNIVDQFKILARKKKISLIFSGENSLFLKIDPYAFESIINNIVDNAIKYTGENGHVEVIIKSKGDNIIIVVQDDGIGISQKHLDNLFLPYYQVSRKKRNIQGLGLGLCIVKSIIINFKGRIEVYSKENVGTTVEIIFLKYVFNEAEHLENYIPSNYDYEIPKTTLDMKSVYDKNKPVVFIVEDNIELISFMQRSMCEDFNILYATDGKEGLETLCKGPKPDIIISDIMMDEMDGHEFYNNLIAIERLRDIPFIFLTARRSREEKLESLKKGVIDYIHKPFDKDELIQKVKSLLKNRQAHTESEIKKMERRLSLLLRMDGDDEFLSFEKKCQNYKLSPREKEVLRGVLEGLQIKEIAGKLFLSVHTVRNHIRHIYHKCKVQNRVELVNLFR